MQYSESRIKHRIKIILVEGRIIITELHVEKVSLCRMIPVYLSCM